MTGETAAVWSYLPYPSDSPPAPCSLQPRLEKYHPQKPRFWRTHQLTHHQKGSRFSFPKTSSKTPIKTWIFSQFKVEGLDVASFARQISVRISKTELNRKQTKNPSKKTFYPPWQVWQEVPTFQAKDFEWRFQATIRVPCEYGSVWVSHWFLPGMIVGWCILVKSEAFKDGGFMETPQLAQLSAPFKKSAGDWLMSSSCRQQERCCRLMLGTALSRPSFVESMVASGETQTWTDVLGPDWALCLLRAKIDSCAQLRVNF